MRTWIVVASSLCLALPARASTCVIGPQGNAPARVTLGSGVSTEADGVCDAATEGCTPCLAQCVDYERIHDLYGCGQALAGVCLTTLTEVDACRASGLLAIHDSTCEPWFEQRTECVHTPFECEISYQGTVDDSVDCGRDGVGCSFPTFNRPTRCVERMPYDPQVIAELWAALGVAHVDVLVSPQSGREMVAGIVHVPTATDTYFDATSICRQYSGQGAGSQGFSADSALIGCFPLEPYFEEPFEYEQWGDVIPWPYCPSGMLERTYVAYRYEVGGGQATTSTGYGCY